MLIFEYFYSSKNPEKNITQPLLKNSWTANQNIRMISEGSCDWSNDAKNSALKSQE